MTEVSGSRLKDGAIVTVTLNPALDRTVRLTDRLRRGEVHRAAGERLSIGGKGMNVSRMLRVLGVRATAFGFAGGPRGERLKQMLREEEIPFCLTECAAETRENVKLWDDGGVCTEINLPGGPVHPSEMAALEDQLTLSTENAQVVVLSGSLPRGLDSGVYERLTRRLHACGKAVVTDCDGEALRKAVLAVPDMIKPNVNELAELLGKTIGSFEQAVGNSKIFHQETGIRVLCTAGADGAVYAGPEGVFHSAAPQVRALGTVGAGDCFLGAFLSRYAVDREVRGALTLALAAAAAKVTCEGTEMPAAADIDRIRNQIEAKRPV